MRIVHLNAGAGSMYCGSCLHGMHVGRGAAPNRTRRHARAPLYAAAYRGAGRRHVASRPSADLNVFLEQCGVVFRHVPAWLNRWLDHPPLLEWLGRRSGSTRPERLGPLCVSMHGRRDRPATSRVGKKLLGLAAIRVAARPRSTSRPVPPDGRGPRNYPPAQDPVVATLSGEDLFLAGLREPYARRPKPCSASEPPNWPDSRPSTPTMPT